MTKVEELEARIECLTKANDQLIAENEMIDIARNMLNLRGIAGLNFTSEDLDLAQLAERVRDLKCEVARKNLELESMRSQLCQCCRNREDDDT